MKAPSLPRQADSALYGPVGHRWVASRVTAPTPSWTVTCSGHAQFTEATYEQVEDAWRKHVHEQTGYAPAPTGNLTAARWTP
jgi:hypothetical protein